MVATVQKSGMVAAVLAASACSGTLQVNLAVNDPCNQQALQSAAYLQLQIVGADVATPQGTTWPRTGGQGEIENLVPTSDATVSVMGRSADGAGGAGDVVAAIGVGLVDLSGQDGEDTVDLSVVLGKVNSFYQTTDARAATRGVPQCSEFRESRRGHTASLLPDGKVLIAGGETVGGGAATIQGTTELYEPTTGLFAIGPVMPVWVRRGHSATVLKDGRVLLAGGVGLINDQVSTLTTAVIYDPEAVDFAAKGVRMGSQRANHTATLLTDGRVLIAGGTTGADSGVSQTTEIFDAGTGEFCPGPTLLQPRAFHAAVTVGHARVALIGGQGENQVLASTEFVTVEGCTGGSAVLGPSLTTARTHTVAQLIPGQDAILVAGGFGAAVTKVENGLGLASAEVIRLNVDRPGQSTIMCPDLQMKAARGAATLVTLDRGFLLAGGLGDDGRTLGSAEIITVASLGSCADVVFEWAGNPMGKPRAGAVATALIGDDVLFTGGFSKDGNQVTTLSQAEIFVRRR